MSGSFSKCTFNSIRNCQTDFTSGCPILHYQQQYVRILVTSLPWALASVLATNTDEDPSRASVFSLLGSASGTSY